MACWTTSSRTRRRRRCFRKSRPSKGQWQGRLVQFHTWDYLAAATSAYSAYDVAVSLAGQLGIEAPAVARVAGGVGMAPHEGDPVRFPDDTLTPAE
ncbi:MAG: hypothetical protein LC739_04625 [Actinobacteria bacterium]|nr:hypothetical protein [Actinomycetota bacterium]